MKVKYKEALHAAQEELSIIEERRIVLSRVIESLLALSEDEFPELLPPPGYVPDGLTDEIRKILELARTSLEPVQIRDSLIQRRVQHSSPKNLLISVHTVLDRIEKELDKTERDGKTAYRMKDVYRSGMRGMESVVEPVVVPPSLANAALKTARAHLRMPPAPISGNKSPAKVSEKE